MKTKRNGFDPRQAGLAGLLAALALAGCAGAPKKAKAHGLTPDQKLALRRYRQGIDAYTNSRYAEAIRDWQVTLEKDPGNPHAAEYIRRAQAHLGTPQGATATAQR